jgi:hypothetical protein
MTDFVTRLEAELHSAAVQRERSGRMRGLARPRLRVALGELPAAALATVLFAMGVACAAIILAASPERPADLGVPATLRGVWQAPPKELRLYPRGADRCVNLGVGSSAACYTLGSSASGVAYEWGRLSVDGDELTLTDTRNPTPGVYRWRVERGTLRLTKVRDPVAARARALVTAPLRLVHPSRARARLPIGWASHPFRSERFGYSIAIPTQWELDTSGPTDRFALHPSRNTLPSVSVVAKELPANTGVGRWQVIVNTRARMSCTRDAWYRKRSVAGDPAMISRFLGCNGADEQLAIVTHRGRGYVVRWRGQRGRMDADAPLFDALLKTFEFSD